MEKIISKYSLVILSLLISLNCLWVSWVVFAERFSAVNEEVEKVKI